MHSSALTVGAPRRVELARVTELASVAVVVIAGLLARCWQIDWNFDPDEVFSIRLATASFSDMILGAMRDTPHPPLHIFLLYLWSKLFGASEVAARALSVACSTGFLLISWQLLRRWLAHWPALLTLALLAFSPILVLYGQQARPYSLIALLASLNLLAFLRFLDAPEPHRGGLAWAATSALLLYAQYMGVLFIGICALYGLIVSPRKRLPIVAFGALAAAAIVPWALTAMWGALTGMKDPVPQIGWIQAPSAQQFVWFYVSIFGESSLLRGRWVLLGLAALALVYLVNVLRTRRIVAEHALLIALGIVIPAAVFLLSVLGDKPVFASRQLLGSAAAFVIVVGLSAATLPRAVCLAVLGGLVAWTIATMPDAFPQRNKAPWFEISDYVESRYGARPFLVDEWWVGFPYSYYRKSGPIVDLDKQPEAIPTGAALYMCRPQHCRETLEQFSLAGRAHQVKVWTWDEKKTLELYELAPR
jgi:4-amino-4-deoxy-L-arabinose transferase-like glycosyltransferase